MHIYIDKLYLGKAYPKIHRRIDEPYKYYGRRHRIFFHDYASAYLIATDCYPDDPDAVWSAYLHILIDDLCSRDPEYRRFLERMESLSREKKRKKHSSKMKKQKPTFEDPFLKDFKKWAEYQRLARVVFY